jgi:hypothetical protein
MALRHFGFYGSKLFWRVLLRLHLRELGFSIVNDDLYSACDAEHPDGENCGPVSDPHSEYNRQRAALIVARLKELTGPPHASSPPLSIADDVGERLAARFGRCDFCPTCLEGGKLTEELSQPRFIGLHSVRYRLAGSHLDLRSDPPLWATRPETLLNRIRPPVS